MGGPPPGYYHPGLVRHPVTVTNLRGTYTDHVATHALALLLALARGLHRYAAQQARCVWESDWDPGAVLPLGESTVLIVGVGAIGTELARLLEPFGGTLIGTDARRTEPPAGVRELHPPEALDSLLPAADAVVLTVPHTPRTERLMARARLDLMKPSAFLVNVGRGPLVDLDDLVSALRDRRLRGAALDVFPEEPLPSGHPLWTTPGVLITPHVAGAGPHSEERRYGVLAENARRFGAGEPLINVVDKAAWF
jgi:phosphoglycerate dehydrogenase-like enzyme